MFEFKTIEELTPNNEIQDIIKNYEYIIENELVKVLINTNLKFIKPTKYLITKPITLTILEYEVNEISNKPFYIKEYNSKCNLKEIKSILFKINKNEEK